MTDGSAIGAVRIRARHDLLSHLRPGWSRSDTPMPGMER
jgi:hypothetical protein